MSNICDYFNYDVKKAEVKWFVKFNSTYGLRNQFDL